MAGPFGTPLPHAAAAGSQSAKRHISIASLVPGQRVVVPLLGNVSIRGKIRLVDHHDHFEIHTMTKVKVKIKKSSHRIKNIALDAGTTDVYTDQNNRRYGTDFGRILAKVDARVTDKGKKRNQSRDAAKNTVCVSEDERQAPPQERAAKQSRSDDTRRPAYHRPGSSCHGN